MRHGLDLDPRREQTFNSHLLQTLQSGLMGIQDANVDTSWGLAAQLYSTRPG